MYYKQLCLQFFGSPTELYIDIGMFQAKDLSDSKTRCEDFPPDEDLIEEGLRTTRSRPGQLAP
jgi:hypothetical protein